MRKRIYIPLIAVIASMLIACEDYPIDEDGLLITTQTNCFVGNFILYGTDHIDCLIQDSTVIDNENLTINVLAKFGTNLQKVKPAASLSIDSKIEPAMGIWTDFTSPKNYTVISGNRQVEKEYTITVRLQGE